LKRRVYSHKNLITEVDVFPKDFHNYLRMDHDTYLRLLLLATPFIAKEDNTYKQQETGKIRPQGGKRIDFFVRDFCIHRDLKDAATLVGEFLKAWTVQAEP
jgi:hypothetical protein